MIRTKPATRSKEITVKIDDLHAGQWAVYSNPARFKVLNCGRRWGKSTLAEGDTIGKMLSGKYCSYITPAYSLGEYLYEETLGKLPEAVVQRKNSSRLRIDVIGGGYVQFFSGEDNSLNRSIRGRKFHDCKVDEAAYIDGLQDKWSNVIRPTLLDYRGTGMFISTPNGIGDFNAFYEKGVRGEGGFLSWNFPTGSNPFMPADELEEIRLATPAAIFEQEYLAIPKAGGDNPFGLLNIEACLQKQLAPGPAVVYGIDLAKYGDYTVIVGLNAFGKVCEFERFQKPWELTKEVIKNLPADVNKVMDKTGVGDVLFESLTYADNVQNLYGYQYTAESKPKLVMKLIKAIEQKAVGILEPIAAEMRTTRYVYGPTGKIKFEARPGYHDDTWNALALAWFNFEESLANINFQLF